MDGENPTSNIRRTDPDPNSEVDRMSEADEEHVAQTKVKDKSRLPTIFLLLLLFETPPLF